jgi:predicted RNA-binding protein YlqC (UPF0109 family)
MSQAEELISYIAQSLVEQPEQVRVYTKDLRRTTILKLQVAQEDTGRVVGKHGRIATAMRSVLEVITRDEEKPVVLEID